MMTKAAMREGIDLLTEQQLETVAALMEELLSEENVFLAHLKTIPGIRIPSPWPPKYEKFEPMELDEDEELPSERLIRERR